MRTKTPSRTGETLRIHHAVALHYQRGLDIELLESEAWYLNASTLTATTTLWMLEGPLRLKAREVRAWGLRPAGSAVTLWQLGDDGLESPLTPESVQHSDVNDRELAIALAYGPVQGMPSSGRFADGLRLRCVSDASELRVNRIARYLRLYADDAFAVIRSTWNGFASVDTGDLLRDAVNPAVLDGLEPQDSQEFVHLLYRTR